MASSARYFRVDSVGFLVRVPYAMVNRWWQRREAVPAHFVTRAGEFNMLEVIVEVDRRQVTRIWRILPGRTYVGPDGRLSKTNMRIAGALMAGIGRFAGAPPVDPIALLQAHANAFWVPSQAQLEQLGPLLFGRPLTEEELDAVRERVSPQRRPSDFT